MEPSPRLAIHRQTTLGGALISIERTTYGMDPSPFLMLSTLIPVSTACLLLRCAALRTSLTLGTPGRRDLATSTHRRDENAERDGQQGRGEQCVSAADGGNNGATN